MFRIPPPPIKPGPQFPAGSGFGFHRRQMPTRRQGPAIALDRFARSFRNEQQRQKQSARQEAMADLNLLQQGIPVDQGKLAKKLRKAGIDLDYEGPTPMEMMEQQQAQQGANPQPVAAPVPQHLPGQGPGGGGIMGAIKRRLSPPDIPKNAGVFKMLDDLKRRGQMNADLSQVEGQVKLAAGRALTDYGKYGGSDPRGMAALQTLSRINPEYRSDLVRSEEARKLFPGAIDRMQHDERRERQSAIRRSIVPQLLRRIERGKVDDFLQAVDDPEASLEQFLSAGGVDPAEVSAAMVGLGSAYDLAKIPEPLMVQYATAKAGGDAETLAHSLAEIDALPGAKYKAGAEGRAERSAAIASERFEWDKARTEREQRAAAMANRLADRFKGAEQAMAAISAGRVPSDLADEMRGMTADVQRFLRGAFTRIEPTEKTVTYRVDVE